MSASVSVVCIGSCALSVSDMLLKVILKQSKKGAFDDIFLELYFSHLKNIDIC
jgi:hypothetical protein